MKFKTPRQYIQLTVGEEIGNAITHGVMAFALLVVQPFIAVYAYTKGGFLLVNGVSIFILSLFLMFMTSCLYHSMAYNTPHKKVFQILDHIFIYVAIAGSYTPIALSLIGGWQGILILVVQWSSVLAGVLYNSIASKKMPKVSLTIYLMMGWTAVLFLPTLWQKADPLFIGLIGLGGVLYSVGAWFYAQKERAYFHFIWHLFINFAAITHFIAIVFFI
ncbi:MAG: hemolysin III family protein [Erysipelotrichaceae bacterium]